MIPPTNTTSSRGDWLAWLFVTALCGALFFGLAKQSAHTSPTTPTPQTYYAYMTDAVLSGQLALKIEPNPELLALTDPYDSSVNAPYRVLDLSLYHRHYYFYWGLGPVFLLLAPWHLVMGSYLGDSPAAAVFTTACVAVLAGLLLEIRRRHFPAAGWVVTFLALGAVASGSFLAVLPMSDSVYGVPIACAALCQAVVWYAIYRALTALAPLRWTLLAGAALAFAIGSRANYVIWAPCLLLPLLRLWKTHPTHRVALTLAAMLPPVAALSALFTLNWLRFGQFTEFGMYYQLTASGHTYVSLSLANLAANWGAYGWTRQQWIRFFPFVIGPTAGLFNLLPLVYGIVGLRSTRQAPEVRVLGWTCALAGLGGMVAMACLPWATTRYSVDYLSAALLAGSLGGLALCDWAGRSGRLTPRWTFGIACAVTFALSACLQAGYWGTPYARLRPLGRVLNAPAFALDQVLGKRHGVEVLTFRLPTNRTGAFEPLLSTGTFGQGEVVFLEYQDATHVRMGFFQTATTHWISQPIPIDYAETHVVRVTLGSLGPPDSDPLFDRWVPEARERSQLAVKLTLDGDVIYQTSLDFGMRRGEPPRIAENGVDPAVCAAHFSGQMLGSRVEGYPRTYVEHQEGPEAYGARVIDLIFPAAPTPGRRDPLVISGVPGAGDLVYVTYPSPGKVAFAHDRWNYGGSVSSPIAEDLTQPHRVVVSYDGLRQPKAAGESPEGARPSAPRLVITVDGQVVMDVGDGSYPAAPDTVTVGENRIGGSSTAATFSGTILSTHRQRE